MSDDRSRVTRTMSQWQQLHLRHVAHRRLVDWPPCRNAMVLAPHPDDEVLGVGGTMLKLARHAELHLVYLTDGRAAADSPAGEAAMAATRRSEARAVAAMLGTGDPTLVGWNEREFARPEHEAVLVARLAEILRQRKPDLVFVPFLWDAHGDHRYANHLLAKALLATGLRPTVAGYEVWSMAPPGWVVDVSVEFPSKLALLDCHASQLRLFDYRAMAHQRAVLHAALAPGATHCEVFWPVRGDAYVEIVAGIDLASPAAQETIVLLTPPETMP